MDSNIKIDSETQRKLRIISEQINQLESQRFLICDVYARASGKDLESETYVLSDDFSELVKKLETKVSAKDAKF